jgi:hypothetical protein
MFIVSGRVPRTFITNITGVFMNNTVARYMRQICRRLGVIWNYGSLGMLCLLAMPCIADEFESWPVAISQHHAAQIQAFHPLFDFDSDGCYPATPFNRHDGLRQNPGLAATWRYEGGCRDAGWWRTANTLHRQLCQRSTDGWLRCAHMFELYFEKDQAVMGSFLGGHRHDIETVIVWTIQPAAAPSAYISHVSASAHGKFNTKPFASVQQHQGHPLIVYHKDNILTHAFRFASASDKANVEFLGNWGLFITPPILSYYRATATTAPFSVVANAAASELRWQQNQQYRLALQQANFSAASFKTAPDERFLAQLNTAMPRQDVKWQGITFTRQDVIDTEFAELSANYPDMDW